MFPFEKELSPNHFRFIINLLNLNFKRLRLRYWRLLFSIMVRLFFLLCWVEIALVRIGFCIKHKLHFTPTALSSNSQFHFRQSLTKTLQFLAKHGLPLLLLWLVMASGFRWEGTPFFTFPSLNFTILTQNSTVKNFPSLAKNAIFMSTSYLFPFLIGLQSKR